MSAITTKFLILVILLLALLIIFALINRRIKSQRDKLEEEIEASRQRIKELRKKIRKARNQK
jgi:flagellar biosynthesis/type III secretory pathway M-ring protein FliF/YscJ